MRSGQLASLAHLSTDTLRHYERLGLLPKPKRTPGNYRDYPPSSEQRVLLIQRALRVGFSLAELQAILAIRDKGGAPCRQVRQLLSRKLVAIGKQIAALSVLRVELLRLSKDWDTRLRKGSKHQPARLLESVPADFASIPQLALRKFPPKKGSVS